jgi:hypothetical protein
MESLNKLINNHILDKTTGNLNQVIYQKIAFIANLSSDDNTDYIRLYKDIFNLDQKIRFAATCDWITE